MASALARTALRLSTVAALEADPVIAAGCEGRIYDSLMGSFQSDEPVPVIVVASEDDNGEAYSANDGGPPFDTVVDLTFEITVCSSVAQDDDDIDIFVPATDRESEALLDLLEARAIYALTSADTPQSVLVRDVVVRRVTRYRSVRYTSEDTGAKLARRLVTITTELLGDQPDDPFDLPSGPFAALPDPLRSVAAALPAGSSGLATCQALVAKLTAPVAPADFAGITATIAPQQLDPDTAPDPADPNVPAFDQEIDFP